MLWSQLGIWVPAGIEQHEQGANVVLRCDGEKLVETCLKAFRILLPEQIMKEYPHGVHPKRFSPTQFLVDLLWIKGLGLHI
jgi:hypothetical protein